MTIQLKSDDSLDRRKAPLGGAVSYRKLSKADDPAIIRHFLRLSPDDRHKRFFGPVKKEVIQKLCADRPWRESVVFGAFVKGTMRGVGELVWHWPTSLAGAEIALSVEAKYQNAGLGSDLLGRLLMTARNRYVGRVNMLCLADNIRMQRVAKKFEAELVFQQSETEGRIWPPMPSYISIIQEALGDSETFFNAVFDTYKT